MRETKEKKGMSLIVLVITIIVMIVLAGVVVIGLTSNNPIAKANEAKFKSGVKSYATELTTTLVTKMALDPTTDFENLSVSSEDIKSYIPSMNSMEADKYIIRDGEIAYVGNNKSEEEWIKQIDVLDANPLSIEKFKNVDTTLRYIDTIFPVDNTVIIEERMEGHSYPSICKYEINDVNTRAANFDLDQEIVLKQVIKTNDGSYIIAATIEGNSSVLGVTTPPSSRGDVVIIKLNSNFELVQAKLIPELKTDANDVAIKACGDGTYSCIVQEGVPGSVDLSFCLYAIKLDSNLNAIPNSRKMIEEYTSSPYIFYVRSFNFENDGYLYVFGSKRRNDYSEKDSALIKQIDENGNIIREYNIENESENINFNKGFALSNNVVIAELHYRRNGLVYDGELVTIDLNEKTHRIIRVPNSENRLGSLSRGYKDNVMVTVSNVTIPGEEAVLTIYDYDKNLDLRWQREITFRGYSGITNMKFVNKNTYVAFGFARDEAFGSDVTTATGALLKLVPMCE